VAYLLRVRTEAPAEIAVGRNGTVNMLVARERLSGCPLIAATQKQNTTVASSAFCTVHFHAII
jgi:hypothetical protein